jgi:hypothetical protein
MMAASRAAQAERPSPTGLFSLRRLLRLGSAAAAVGSILGLALTVGDRAVSVFERGGSTGVHLEQVLVEPMPFRTYLQTREKRDVVKGLGYTERDLDAEVLVVDYEARFEGWSRGATFDVDLGLQTRDAKGRIRTIDVHRMKQTLDAANDYCGCYSFFFVPEGKAEYRVEVQILRTNARDAEPLQRRHSDWYAG